MKLEYFTRAQITKAVAEVREKWGSMWHLVGPEVRDAFVEQHVLHVMLTVSLTQKSLDKAVLQELLQAMRVEAGVIGEDD